MRYDSNQLIDRKFIGIPYIQFKKTTDDLGFGGTNCIGICILWMKDQGFDYKFDDGKGASMRHWWAHSPRRFADALFKFGNTVRFNELSRYDVLLFFSDKDDTTRFPTHMGIMVDGRNYLTASQEKGSYVKMLDMTDKKKFFGAIRLHKVVEKLRNG